MHVQCALSAQIIFLQLPSNDTPHVELTLAWDKKITYK